MPSAQGSTSAVRKERKEKGRDVLCIVSDGGKTEFVASLGAPVGPPWGLFLSQVLPKSPLPEAEKSGKGEVEFGDIWTGSH